MTMTPEQFAQKQAAELAAFNKEQALARKIANCGIPMPDYIGGKLYGAQVISYRNPSENQRTLAQALEMFKLFTVVPMNVLRKSCAIVAPEKELPEKQVSEGYKIDPYKNGGDYALKIEVRHISESPAPTSAKLVFYARADDILFQVSIDFGTGYIGSCPQLAPKVSTETARNGRVISRNFSANAILNGACDSLLSYASGDYGPVKNSAHHCYFLIAENGPEDITGANCLHALEMLGNVAAEIEPTK